MAALSEVLEPRCVEHFLIKGYGSYEDLIEEIKNQFPGVRRCTLRSVKRFCSQHGIKKQMPVSDETAMKNEVKNFPFFWTIEK